MKPQRPSAGDVLESSELATRGSATAGRVNGKAAFKRNGKAIKVIMCGNVSLSSQTPLGLVCNAVSRRIKVELIY